jgi:hypothetical protein
MSSGQLTKGGYTKNLGEMVSRRLWLRQSGLEVFAGRPRKAQPEAYFAASLSFVVLIP